MFTFLFSLYDPLLDLSKRRSLEVWKLHAIFWTQLWTSTKWLHSSTVVEEEEEEEEEEEAEKGKNVEGMVD